MVPASDSHLHARSPESGNGRSAVPADSPGGMRARPDPEAAGLAREVSLADTGPLLRHIGRVVGRYWWLGLGLAAIEIALFAAYMAVRQPTSTAEATLLAESEFDVVLRGDDRDQMDRDRYENIMRNHLAIMMSRGFRSRLAESLSDEEAREVQAPYLEAGEEPSTERLESILAGSLSVERERGRDLFTVRAVHPDPATAVWLADRFAELYLGEARGDVRGANHRAKEALEREAGEIDRGIEALETTRLDFRRRFDAITGGGGREVIAQRIASLDSALSLVRIERARAEVEHRRAVEDLAASPMPFNNPQLGAFGNSAALSAEIDRREAERAMLATHYGANHPKLLEANEALETLQRALRQNFATAVEELDARVQLATSREAALESDLKALLDQSAEVERVSAELTTLDQRIAAHRSAHANLLNRIAEAGISAELPADVMRVVDHASVRHPVLPPGLVLGAAGVGGAALLFVGGPLLWHASRRRISSTLDLEGLLGTELYGVVPRLRWMWSSQRPHLVRRGRKAAVVESFLGAASQFELRFPGGCPKRIVISSTLPGEGKSVVASNLAAAFTRLGYRSLLVDADFRRPTQQRFHRVPNSAGLLRWIEGGCRGGGEASLDDIGLHALPGGTWLLPTGGTDPEPARHLMRREVQALFERLSREFDVITIDTPPAGLFPDAFFVTRFADAAALVVREGVPGVDQLRKVLADFRRTSTPVSGIIFNAISGGVAHPSFGYRTVASRYARHYVPSPRQLPVSPRRGSPVPAEIISS